MKILTDNLNLHTKGAGDFLNITADISKVISKSKLKEGSVTVFVVGSTAGITTFEYEPGLIKDVSDLYEKLAPSSKSYQHDATWGDANGFSHLRAALQGPSITIPFERGKLMLGSWQQVVLAEFDNRPRDRIVVLQIIGQ